MTRDEIASYKGSEAGNDDEEIVERIPDEAAPDPRIAALEAALIRVATLFTSDFDGEFETAEVAETRDILSDLRLAHRVWGNPAEAEQVSA